jgi:hypothetical protein
MPARIHRKLWLTLLAAGMILPATTCVTADSQSSLLDLTASTTGNFLAIFIKQCLTGVVAQAQGPDLTAPISQQQH